MPSKTMYLIEEWKSLREEITHKQSFTERLIVSSVGGNLAIYSFALGEALGEPTVLSAFLALLPIVLTTMTYIWLLRGIKSIQRIRKYIIEVLAPELGVVWEIYVQPFRDEKVATRGKENVAEGKIKKLLNRLASVLLFPFRYVSSIPSKIKDADLFSLFYHIFYLASVILFFLILWVPHWVCRDIPPQSSSQVSQLDQISMRMRTVLSISAVLFATIWYALAHWFWIGHERKLVEERNDELKRVAEEYRKRMQKKGS